MSSGFFASFPPFRRGELGSYSAGARGRGRTETPKGRVRPRLQASGRLANPRLAPESILGGALGEGGCQGEATTWSLRPRIRGHDSRSQPPPGRRPQSPTPRLDAGGTPPAPNRPAGLASMDASNLMPGRAPPPGAWWGFDSRPPTQNAGEGERFPAPSLVARQKTKGSKTRAYERQCGGEPRAAERRGAAREDRDRRPERAARGEDWRQAGGTPERSRMVGGEHEPWKFRGHGADPAFGSGRGAVGPWPLEVLYRPSTDGWVRPSSLGGWVGSFLYASVASRWRWTTCGAGRWR